MVGEVSILPLRLNGPQAPSERGRPLVCGCKIGPELCRELTNLVCCTGAQASQHCAPLGFLQTSTLVSIQRTESLCWCQQVCRRINLSKSSEFQPLVPCKSHAIIADTAQFWFALLRKRILMC